MESVHLVGALGLIQSDPDPLRLILAGREANGPGAEMQAPMRM